MNGSFSNSSLDPTLDDPSAWSVEPAESALERTSELGRQFFDRLWRRYPEYRASMVFVRWSAQPDDVYAIHDAVRGFRVQIDLALELVIVWDGATSGEYGAWTPDHDPVADALAHIGEAIAAP